MFWVEVSKMRSVLLKLHGLPLATTTIVEAPFDNLNTPRWSLIRMRARDGMVACSREDPSPSSLIRPSVALRIVFTRVHPGIRRQQPGQSASCAGFFLEIACVEKKLCSILL